MKQKSLTLISTIAVMLFSLSCHHDNDDLQDVVKPQAPTPDSVDNIVEVDWNNINLQASWSEELLAFVVPTIQYEDSTGMHKEKYTGTSNAWEKKISLVRKVDKEITSVTEQAYASYKLKDNVSIDESHTYYFWHVLDVSSASGSFGGYTGIYINNSLGRDYQIVEGCNVQAYLNELTSRMDTVSIIFTKGERNIIVMKH